MVTIEVARDGLTSGLQLSINDTEGGYRLAGPKFSGTSVVLLSHVLTAEDARFIRLYLDAEFPVQAVAS